MTFNSRATTGAKSSGFNTLSVGSVMTAYSETVIMCESIVLKGDINLRYNCKNEYESGVKVGAEFYTKYAAVHEKLTLTTEFSFFSGTEAKLWLSVKDSSERIIYSEDEIKVTRGRDDKAKVTTNIDGLLRGFRRDFISIEWYQGLTNKIGTRMPTIYFFPHKPNLPWVWDTASNQNPWVTALDMLLKWGVVGESDTKRIARKITEYVYSSEKFKYDAPVFDASGKRVEGIGTGKSQLSGNGKFLCTTFIGIIPGANKKNPIVVNCSDCATVVSTFSNLLGANLYQTRFGASSFHCNKVKTIGFDAYWQYPFPKIGDLVSVSVADSTATGGSFSYHEVAVNGPGMTISEEIYDACLKVNPKPISYPDGRNEKGKNENGVLPVGMEFALYPVYDYIYNGVHYGKLTQDDEEDFKYRERLILNKKLDLSNGVFTGYGCSTGRRPME